MAASRLRNVVVAVAILAVHAGVARGQLIEASRSVAMTPDGNPLEVTTGYVRVPELRSQDGTSSSMIDLFVVRVRQLGVVSTPNAHVLLAGGPGDSGVNLVMGLVRQGRADVWTLFDGDVVGIDQRGTGRSRPNLDTQVRYHLPLNKPGSPSEWLPYIERANRKVASEFRARGIRLEAYNTRESADDIADVRRALGYEKFTLWGRSYGSHLALATVARHPRIVDRLLLVSPEGPNHSLKLPFQVDVVIRRLVERGATQLEGHIRQVLRRLTSEPVTATARDPQTGTPTTLVLGAFDVQWITAQALGDPRLVAGLPSIFREMVEGNFDRMAQIAFVRRSRAGVGSAMKHMMDLSSGASDERRRQIENEARSALLEGAINFPGILELDGWAPVTDLGEDFRSPVENGVSTLILVGDLDPRTPLVNAQEIAATLPSAQTVVVENATHQFDVFGSPMIRTVLARFLRGENVATQRLTLPAIVFQD